MLGAKLQRMTTPLPTFYLSHGGGPWPYMKVELGDQNAKLEAALADVPRQAGPSVRAILVVSAHWEGTELQISASAAPPMLYDYGGFPAHTYQVRYPAPGSPSLARRVQELLQAGAHPAHMDAHRGFDHGTFCMLAPMYPAADVPIVQLSLRGDFDARAHLEIGRLLAPLRHEGVLILGSGSSYHNLRHFGVGGAQPSHAFDAWLQHSLTKLPADVRAQQLVHWQAAPAARMAHPREEHLLPLMVAVGAAIDDPGHCVYFEPDVEGYIAMSSYRFSAR